MEKEIEILYIKSKIEELESELYMLCDSDYYNQCDLIEQYKLQLEELERGVRMNNYKSFSELKEELGNNYDFKLYEMVISALKEIENLQQENKQLKSQWCKLKEYLHNVDVVVDYSENYDGRFINYDELVNKTQEIEQGSDE